MGGHHSAPRRPPLLGIQAADALLSGLEVRPVRAGVPLEQWVALRGPLSLSVLHDSLDGALVAGVLLLLQPLE